ncbi:hypothetical protein SPF06_11585 [Sinomonas sp. JGH33]|uniref:Secreted protein n=1 Tax=Sinomonas terricola TaxID=3110330 RepID=A0ABU5T701_9MICC|nr:hypothetical protein [Sinomonas sp. JGH33]MEA5455363.1 hypothetical protein [Sinomonas sp. JGH33]
MKPLFWLAFGGVVGAIAYRKVQQLRAAPAEGGLNRALNGVADSTARFADHVRIAMAEREAELRKGLGLDV